MLNWIAYIPELISIFRAVKARIEKSEQNRKIKDDLAAIEKAFNEKDSAALNHIFNDQLPNPNNKF